MVTRLFSFPTRLSVLLEDPLLSESLRAPVNLLATDAASFFFVFPCVDSLAARSVSSPLTLLAAETSVAIGDSDIEAVSGVVAAVVEEDAVGVLPPCVWAFIRMRNACSKTSSVSIPSHLTNVPVYIIINIDKIEKITVDLP